MWKEIVGRFSIDFRYLERKFYSEKGKKKEMWVFESGKTAEDNYSQVRNKRGVLINRGVGKFPKCSRRGGGVKIHGSRNLRNGLRLL